MSVSFTSLGSFARSSSFSLDRVRLQFPYSGCLTIGLAYPFLGGSRGGLTSPKHLTKPLSLFGSDRDGISIYVLYGGSFSDKGYKWQCVVFMLIR